VTFRTVCCSVSVPCGCVVQLVAQDVVYKSTANQSKQNLNLSATVFDVVSHNLDGCR